jgi:predicted nucleic acid-binding protein
VRSETAEASGGGITDPPQTVRDWPDWEDNRILDLAAAAGALLIVSDADLTSMSPWRGRPVIELSQFACSSCCSWPTGRDECRPGQA